MSLGLYIGVFLIEVYNSPVASDVYKQPAESAEKQETMKLDVLTQKLDDFFKIRELDADPAMSRFIPMVYDPIGFDWKSYFEADYTSRFNGLMIKGAENVGKVWCVSFPSDEVLSQIMAQAEPGDMIFAHHPVNMECGDPRGSLGKGFLPVNLQFLDQIKAKGLSFYACHAPLDYNEEISTSASIGEAIGGKTVGRFYPYGNGFAGVVCEVPVTTTDALIEKLKVATGLDYVDSVGVDRSDITRISIVAGGGGDVEDIQEGDKQGVQCHIGGEVTSKIDNERGRKEKTKVEAYLNDVKISVIGISHAGSEFIVLRDQLAPWIEQTLGIKAEAVPEKHWWR